jgi:hypothetical protein
MTKDSGYLEKPSLRNNEPAEKTPNFRLVSDFGLHGKVDNRFLRCTVALVWVLKIIIYPDNFLNQSYQGKELEA